MNCARILVVDDDPDFAETMAEVLSLSGHQVTTAGTGEDAIRLTREQTFDICFMDIKLPGMNGLESFLEIHRRCAGTRFVMMTGYSLEQMLEQATSSGAAAVLRKPFDMGEVAALVDRLGSNGVVLVADDDPDFAETLREELETRGYTVSIVRDGAKALETVRAGGVDLLILDLRLPVLSGIEVFVELRKSGRAVPTIIVTGYAREELASIEALRKLAVTGVLTKPFEATTLLAAVESVMARKGAGPPRPFSPRLSRPERS
jgi:DNA-binding response OmpR family regulator